MDWRFVSQEVLYPRQAVPFLSRDDLLWLQKVALEGSRKRARFCLHPDPDDPLHEMLIVQARGNYVPPHKHKGKPESFLLLEGEVDVVIFDDKGEVVRIIELSGITGGKIFYTRLPPDTYHTVIFKDEVNIFMETTTGPFFSNDMIVPSWASSSGNGGKKIVEDKVARFVRGCRC